MKRVYIDNFEMPETCSKCPFVTYWEYDNEPSCKATKKLLWNDSPNKIRHPECPLKTT